MTTRTSWDVTRKIIERHVGPVHSARQVNDGLNSEIAVIINESTFVKGLRTGHPRAWTQERERLVNPHIRHLSAPLNWTAEEDGWNLLGFGIIHGHHADYSPASTDLPLIVSALNAIGRVPCPQVPLKLAQERWADYCERPQLFTGDALLHTEWNPTNVLVCDGAAHVIDWAWATRGATWIDAAAWLVFLVASGHSPSQAQRWASQVDAWATATETGVTEFARAQAAMWREISDGDDQAPKWIVRAAKAARDWVAYREQ